MTKRHGPAVNIRSTQLEPRLDVERAPKEQNLTVGISELFVMSLRKNVLQLCVFLQIKQKFFFHESSIPILKDFQYAEG